MLIAPPKAAIIAEKIKAVENRDRTFTPMALAISRSEAAARIVLPHHVPPRMILMVKYMAIPAMLMNME
jgi:hypothetical protein